jgi:hypothetical protein
MIDAATGIMFGGQSSSLLIGMLFVITALACGSQYTAIGSAGYGPLMWRLWTAMGWTLLTVRFAFSYLYGVPPLMPPVAAFSVILVGIGAILRNVVDSACYDGYERRRKECFPPLTVGGKH